MPTLEDIYGGILRPGPLGGLYEPGPDVVFPRQSQPLTKRTVQTVAVDPFTGTPLTVGGMNANDVIADIPGPAPMAPPPTIDAATPLDGYRLALTPTPPPAAPLSPAVTAIDTAAPAPVAPAQQAGLPMSERNPGDWLVRAWLDQGSTMPPPAMNNPAAPMMGNPQVAQAMAARAPQQAAPPSQVLRAMVDQQRNKVASTDPRRGKKIMTANNGEQTVGTRLNNSRRGFTVTGDDWFNSVRGL